MLPGRVYAQLALLQRQGTIDRVGSRGKATYFIKAKRAADVPLPVNDLQRLHVEVSKAEKTVAFVFEGLHFTVRRKGIAVSIVIDFVLEIGNGVYVLSPITRAADEWLVAHLPPNALVRDRYVVVPRKDLEAVEAALAASGLRVVRTT